MKNIAVIPARGGSKRIPRKNIKNFLGIPIINYSIRIAMESNIFDEIMVSTDDMEIAEIALKCGAKVPFLRSDINSNDFATTYDVIHEVLVKYEKQGNYFNNTCCIYPCAPLISKNNIVSAFDLLLNNNFDTVVPVVKYTTPIQRALKFEENKIMMIKEKYRNSRSQDLDSCYFDAGQFYWINNSIFSNVKTLFTNNTGAIILNDLNAQDIDNDIDCKIAELKYKLINN